MKRFHCPTRSDLLLRKALIVSLAVHLGGIVALAAWHVSAPERPQIGQDRTSKLVLIVRHSSERAEAAQRAESPVVVTPDFARLADVSYVRSRVQAVDIENLISQRERSVQDLAPQLAPDVQPPVEMPRPSRRTASIASEHPSIERPAPPVGRANRAAPPTQSLRAEELEVEGDSQLAPPDFRGNSPPAFPAEARQQRWEGVVRLRLHVAEDGRVTQVAVVESSGYPMLDAAAVGAVRNWHGQPASRNGRPVATVWDLPIRFRLR